ncbi:hypothetical protein NFC81_06500 [Salinispirillum sp. LH 10-3-1]|uniref:Uncharacterized protein n=1 Tax=Salinispirillum sp. LH 10-3-1 TaxID=2952525 RepID=A0AB38YJ09_9GAMM
MESIVEKIMTSLMDGIYRSILYIFIPFTSLLVVSVVKKFGKEWVTKNFGSSESKMERIQRLKNISGVDSYSFDKRIRDIAFNEIYTVSPSEKQERVMAGLVEEFDVQPSDLGYSYEYLTFDNGRLVDIKIGKFDRAFFTLWNALELIIISLGVFLLVLGVVGLILVLPYLSEVAVKSFIGAVVTGVLLLFVGFILTKLTGPLNAPSRVIYQLSSRELKSPYGYLNSLFFYFRKTTKEFLNDYKEKHTNSQKPKESQ